MNVQTGKTEMRGEGEKYGEIQGKNKGKYRGNGEIQGETEVWKVQGGKVRRNIGAYCYTRVTTSTYAADCCTCFVLCSEIKTKRKKRLT